MSIVKLVVAKGGEADAGFVEEERHELSVGDFVEVTSAEVVAGGDGEVAGIDFLEGVQCLADGGSTGDAFLGRCNEGTVEVIDAENGDFNGACVPARDALRLPFHLCDGDEGKESQPPQQGFGSEETM